MRMREVQMAVASLDVLEARKRIEDMAVIRDAFGGKDKSLYDHYKTVSAFADDPPRQMGLPDSEDDELRLLKQQHAAAIARFGRER